MWINCHHSNGKRCALKQITLDRSICAECPERCPRDGPKCIAEAKPAAIPREKWGPGLAEWIEQATPEDIGIGSTLKRIGTPEAKALMIQLTHGTMCKCRDRVAAADALYPY